MNANQQTKWRVTSEIELNMLYYHIISFEYIVNFFGYLRSIGKHSNSRSVNCSEFSLNLILQWKLSLLSINVTLPADFCFQNCHLEHAFHYWEWRQCLYCQVDETHPWYFKMEFITKWYEIVHTSSTFLA